MHTRNLQALAAEMFKVHQNLSPTIVAEIFRARRKNYNLRRSSFFHIRYGKTVYRRSQSLSNLGLRIWNLVSSTLKKLDDVNSFKAQFKKLQPENCPCRPCKTHVPHVGFIVFFLSF